MRNKNIPLRDKKLDILGIFVYSLFSLSVGIVLIWFLYIGPFSFISISDAIDKITNPELLWRFKVIIVSSLAGMGMLCLLLLEIFALILLPSSKEELVLKQKIKYIRETYPYKKAKLLVKKERILFRLNEINKRIENGRLHSS